MSDVFDGRVFLRVDMEHALRGPDGWRTPDTHSLVWFFEVPVARNTDEAWNELLNRIFYDSNVRLRRCEPGDQNWMSLESFRVSPIDMMAMMSADAKTWLELPWVRAEIEKVWELMPCYFVDDAGRYDVTASTDFIELIMLRLLGADRIDQAAFVQFFDRIYAQPDQPPVGQQFYDNRAERLKNLVGIRDSVHYQKTPGEMPWASGPVDVSLLG